MENITIQKQLCLLDYFAACFAVLSGANTVSAAAPRCHHGVKSTAEIGGKN